MIQGMLMNWRERVLPIARQLARAAGVCLAVMAVASASEPQPIDACALLTASDVAALLGMPVTEGVRHDEGLTSVGAYSSTCIWKVRNDRLGARDPTLSLGGADFAILNAFSWPSRSGAVGFLQSFRSAADRHEIPMHPIGLKLGDEGLWWGDGVAVRRGLLSFGVSVVLNSADRAQRRVWEEALAKEILTRLPAEPSQERK